MGTAAGADGSDAAHALHQAIAADLAAAGRVSPYLADADESDPRYRSYGVRARQKDGVIRTHRSAIRALAADDKLALAQLLIRSGYGEQQSVGLYVLELLVDGFGPTDLPMMDGLVRRLHGWSKVDAFTGSVLATLLFRWPEEMLDLVHRWNRDPDPWLRRTSVVLFTRKVAASRQFDEVAIELCDRLVHDEHDLVRKGVGWTLKDLMRNDRTRVAAYVERLRAAGVSSAITTYAIRELDPAERQRILAVKPTRRDPRGEPVSGRTRAATAASAPGARRADARPSPGTRGRARRR